jgi:hypothetical protein
MFLSLGISEKMIIFANSDFKDQLKNNGTH